MVFALMLCQKHGVPQFVCRIAAMGLLMAECSIKTKHGVSLATCSSTDDHATHGPEQGSRMAPALWLVISCLLFEAMTKLCQGAEFCNARQSASHTRTGDGFVDNVTNFRNFGLADMLLHDCGPVELASGSQHKAQTWERLLCSTGGQLELSKHLHCLMMFDFKPDGAPSPRKAADMGTDLINLTTGASNTKTEIKHRNCFKAHRTLGLHPAPNGCQLAQALRATAFLPAWLRHLELMQVPHRLLDDVAPQHDPLSSLQPHDQAQAPPRPEEDDQCQLVEART
jgi:hypothetical protein